MNATANHPNMLTAPDNVVEAIREMRRPIMIAHVVPDADALGSMFAMARAWSSTQRQTKASLPSGVLSKRLAFMAEWAGVAVATEEDFQAADGFVVLDTAKQPRCNVGPALKETDWRTDRPVVNVDHHVTNTQFGSVNWIVDAASSTAELVYYVLVAADLPIDATTASLLFAGIQTDSIGFSLPTVSPSTLHVAGELAAHGADVGGLGERLFRSQSRSEFDLLRVIYANTKVSADGQVAYSYADYDEICSAGCSAADIDDQISVPRSLDGVRLAMLFTEGRKGKTRINFRGSGDVMILDLAHEFGGGGHSQAAGAILDCSVAEAIERVVSKAEQYLKRF